jgi:hypothetical protein
MRRLISAALIACVFAAPSLAATGKARPTPPPKTVALRGAQSPVPAASSVTGTSTAPTVSWFAAGADAASCRQGCAQTRYFCESGQNPDDCASTWGQCAAACSAPNLSTPSAAAN